jgi:hypothetical protein
MIKADELTNPESCMSRALPNEMTFVLLGRDRCAPWVVRFWAILRVLWRKNRWNDPQIREAFECARRMRDVRGEQAR